MIAVFVNYRGADLTRAAVNSYRQRGGGSVIVVDNGSGGQETQELQKFLASEEMLLLPANDGYAAAANLGLALAFQRGADGALLLNNDLLFLDELAAFREAARRLPGHLLGPLICADEAGTIVEAAGISLDPLTGRHRLLAHGSPAAGLGKAPFMAVALPGTALYLPRSAYRALGGLPADYWAYFEDVAYCLSAARQGIRSFVVPAMRICHRRAATFNQYAGHDRYYYGARNHLRAVREYGAKLRFPLQQARELHIMVLNGAHLLRGHDRWRLDAYRAWLEGIVDYCRGRRGARHG